MQNLFSYSFIFMIIIVIIVSCMSAYQLDYSNYNINEEEIYASESGYVWPIPGFTRISSYYGARTSPTTYASSFHYGLDIPAVEGTYFLSSISGTVVFTGFKGSGGYTIIVENDNVRVIYCHVSPSFLVNVRRLCGKSTSVRSSSDHTIYMMSLITHIMIKMEFLQIGATTGCHLHFAIKINGSYQDPLLLIPIINR